MMIMEQQEELNPLEVLSLAFGEGSLVSYYRGEYRFECPKCSGKIHANMPKGGVFLCYMCGYKGNAYTVSLELGLFPEGENPKEINNLFGFSYTKKEEPVIDWGLLSSIYSEIISNGSLREYHSRWLSNRGIITDKNNPLKFKGVSSDGIYHRIKDKFTTSQLLSAGLLSQEGKTSGVIRGNRIIIPYYSSIDYTCNYIRSRFVGITEDYRFLAPVGVPASKFTWGWETYNNSHYVIVTEGELKAQSAKQLGLECIALPGMQVAHQAFMNTCIQKEIETVFILFDSENKIDIYTGIRKQDEINKWANSLAKMLNNNNIQAIICHLPLLGYQKIDIDKFILIKQEKAKEELIEILKQGVLYK